MSRKHEFTVAVHGIGYDVFARLKWRQFLRWFSLAVAAMVLLALIAVLRGQSLDSLPTSAALVLLLAVAAVLAVYRAGLRRAWKASGLGGMELRYTFDRDGWTVAQGGERVRVLWTRTWRVRRDNLALMLYPNRKSVNLVPLKYMTASQLDQVIAWCGGKKA